MTSKSSLGRMFRGVFFTFLMVGIPSPCIQADDKVPLSPQDAAARAEFQRQTQAAVQRIVKLHDTNGNGKLDPDEVLALKQKRQERFARFDTNQDGKLDAAELEAKRIVTKQEAEERVRKMEEYRSRNN